MTGTPESLRALHNGLPDGARVLSDMIDGQWTEAAVWSPNPVEFPDWVEVEREDVASRDAQAAPDHVDGWTKYEITVAGGAGGEFRPSYGAIFGLPSGDLGAAPNDDVRVWVRGNNGDMDMFASVDTPEGSHEASALTHIPEHGLGDDEREAWYAELIAGDVPGPNDEYEPGVRRILDQLRDDDRLREAASIPQVLVRLVDATQNASHDEAAGEWIFSLEDGGESADIRISPTTSHDVRSGFMKDTFAHRYWEELGEQWKPDLYPSAWQRYIDAVVDGEDLPTVNTSTEGRSK